MPEEWRRNFREKWLEYFPGARWPVVFFYSGEERYDSLLPPPPSAGERGSVNCLIKLVEEVFNGRDISLEAERIGCAGGRRYTGFSSDLRPEFRYFLSCGLEGEIEGERYKKSPEIVDQILTKMKFLPAPSRFLVFKRFDHLEEAESPEAVIFLDRTDVISALFTLAGFREAEGGVICPFASGCGSIVYYPRLEAMKERPAAVLGMFDISARPFVEPNYFSISVPIKKFKEMVEDMEESFLIADSWKKIKSRLNSK